MYNKRGISPLIATVLLIGFTVAMAGIVSTFIIKQTKETFNADLLDDSSICDQMSLGVYADATKLVISPGTTINYLKGVYIQNKGSYAVRGLVVSTSNNSVDIQYTFDSRINKHIVTGDLLSLDTLKGDASKQEYYLPPAGTYKFGNPSSPTGIPISKVTNTYKIKVYPIIFDPEKQKGVKCIKSVLVFDYDEICKSYGHKSVTDTSSPCGV